MAIKNNLQKLYVRIAGYLFYLFLICINKTLRIKVLNAHHYYSLKEQKTNVVYIFWHQATFIPLYLYRGQKACIITSKSIRGEILTQAAARMGYRIERISEETEKAADRIKSLIRIIKVLKNGYDTNIAVDGPMGPLHRVKPGAIFLAVKSGLPVLPVAAAAKHKIILSFRWDKYFIPLPFSRVAVNFGAPIYMPKDLSEADYGSKMKMLEEKLLSLTKEAEEGAR